MSVRRFEYFDDCWRAEVLACPQCQWQDLFEQGWVEYYDELMDCSCPKCDVLKTPILLAIVNYPTLEELRANQHRLEIRQYVELIDAGVDKYAERVAMERHQQRIRMQQEKAFKRLCDAIENMPDDADNPQVWAGLPRQARANLERAGSEQPVASC